MDKTVKQILIEANESLFELKTVGEICGVRMFCESKNILVVNHAHKQCYILSRDDTVGRNCYLLLTELLGVLKELDNNKLIYVVEDQVSDAELDVLYCGKPLVKRCISPDTFKLEQGGKLLYTVSGISFTDKEVKLLHCIDVSPLYFDIIRYLFTCVLPTKSFDDYVEKDCMLKQDYQFYVTKTIGWLGILAAVLIALIPYLEKLFCVNK